MKKGRSIISPSAREDGARRKRQLDGEYSVREERGRVSFQGRVFGGVWGGVGRVWWRGFMVCPAAGLWPAERREFRLGLVCR